MTTNLDGEMPLSQASGTMPMKSVPSSVPPGTYRPVLPDRGPGRWFRACAGIKEDLMDWSPAERAKYTGLGIIVLNTGCLAAFAMFTALGKVVSAPALALVPLALVWGWFIFSVDRWLITSTHGVRGLNRVFILVPRLVLAILLAFTIAEPLTLRIFQNTLDSTAQTTRTKELDQYQSQLQTCNPVSGTWVSSAACAGYHLSVANPPYGIQQKLATAKQQQAQLDSVIGAEQAQEQKLTSIAQGECAGTAGASMTGTAGDGPRCKADWAAANAYAQQSGLGTKESELGTLQTSIGGMIQQAGVAQQTYASQLHAAITVAVATRQKDQSKQIGIIEEWNALELLSSQSSFVFFGHWLLVLVMMALDCLPVLAKLMSESSTYDELIAEQRASDERVHATDLRFREETTTVDKEVEIYLAKMHKRDRKRHLDQEERVRNAQGDTDGLDDVRALAARWLRDAGA
ncbi:MAG: DUF4407 domain-containing protein [Streptosporangiaceae bacterium]